MSYSSFRTQNNDVAALKDKFNKLNGKTTFNKLDDTYWTPDHVAGPDGNGEAILRFLPAPPDGNGGQEPDNIVKYFQYSMTKNGKHYINRGRNSLGRDEADPANDYNQSIWARSDLNKDQKKKLLADRKINYIGSVYVVKDTNGPQYEGKVFRYQFGPQIYNKIELALFPEFDSDPVVNVFDPIEGADFVLRVVSKTIPDRITGELKKVPNYDQSKFLAPSKRWDLEEFDKIWEQQLSLQSEISPDKFKPYDELKKHWDRVMGNVTENDSWNNQSDIPASKERTERVVEEPKRPSTSEILDDKLPWDDEDDAGEVDTNESQGFTTSTSESDLDSWWDEMK